MGLDYYPAHISVRSIVVERRKANLAVDRIPHLSTKPGQVQPVFSVCSIVAFARWFALACEHGVYIVVLLIFLCPRSETNALGFARSLLYVGRVGM
jgi:hypothetical protein